MFVVTTRHNLMHNAVYADARHKRNNLCNKACSERRRSFKVKELLGHKTIAMTMRYAHHYPESLRASVEVLDTCHVLVTVKAGNV